MISSLTSFSLFIFPSTFPSLLLEYCYEGTSSNDPSGVDHMWAPSWRNCGSDSNGECGVGTNKRFIMPNNGNQVFWYSFDVGNVHIAMISSEHDVSVGSPMGDWLVNDLENVDHSTTPWVFVAIHRPLVETEQYESDYIVAQNYREIMYPCEYLDPYILQIGDIKQRQTSNASLSFFPLYFHTQTCLRIRWM